MYKAYETDPEYADATYFFDDLENVFIFGNRNLKPLWNDQAEAVYRALDGGDIYDLIGDRSYYSNDTEMFISELRPERKLSTRDVHALKDAFMHFGEYGADNREIFCRVYGMLFGGQWEYCCIRGCSQGDWNYIFHDGLSDKEIDLLEAAYFGTGTEWMIEDEGGEPYLLHYTAEWDLDKVRDELALDGPIEFYRLAGYTRTPRYEIIA